MTEPTGPWWMYLRYDKPVHVSDRRRPIAIDYVSAIGLAGWAIAAARDPEPIYKVNGWQFVRVLEVILPEPAFITLILAIALSQVISALTGRVMARKISASLASAIYVLFANGIGVDAAHPYSAAAWGALFIGNAFVVLRTL